LTRDSLPVATVCVLAVAGALAGLLLGGVVGDRDLAAAPPAPAPRSISDGGLRLQAPSVPERGAAFYSRLPAAVARLESARTAGGGELAAATRAAAQAAAADRLARAHEAAVAALSPLTGESTQTAAVRALTATANAYAALASAARARVPRRYARASRAVTAADARLRRALTRVTAAAEAASRSATRATPASGPTGIDGSFVLLALLGACAIFLAARETLGELDA
jgi:hypothetical protein